jgi:hypothetical protein
MIEVGSRLSLQTINGWIDEELAWIGPQSKIISATFERVSFSSLVLLVHSFQVDNESSNVLSSTQPLLNRLRLAEKTIRRSEANLTRRTPK